MLDHILKHAHVEWEAEDYQAVVDKFNAKVIDVVDNDLYTWAGIALVAGPEAAEQLKIALESSGMSWASQQFGGLGLQLSHPLVKAAMEQFIAAGIPLQPVMDQIEHKISLAEHVLGIPELTLGHIDPIKLNAKKQAAREKAAMDYNTWLGLITNWDGQDDMPKITLGE